MVRFALAILIPVVVGLPFTLWLPSWLARVGVAFLGGVVMVTAAVAAIGLTGLRLSVLSLAPVAAAWLVGASWAIHASRASLRAPASRPRWGWPVYALLAVAALNVATAAAYAVVVPLSAQDAIVIWLPKAHVLEAQGFLGLGGSLFADYPPVWPVHLALADAGGQWWKLLPSAYLVATLLIVFSYVRSKVGPTPAAACVLAISAVPYIWMPYGVNDLLSEIPMTAFVTASTIMLAEYVDQPSAARAAITALAAIGAVWVRPEGFFHGFLIAAILVIAGFRLHRMREGLLSASAIAFAFVAWRLIVRFIFQYTGGLEANLASLTPSVIASTLADIARYAAANAGNPYLFGPALIAVGCIAVGMTRWRGFAIVGFVLIADVAMGTATYAALQSTDVGEPLIWWLTTGFKRMLMHFTPLLYVAAALAVGGIFRQLEAGERTGSQARPRWGGGLVPPVAVVALASICIVVAAYAAYRVGGPKSYDLSAMAPSHVSGSTLDLSTPGVMSVTTSGKPATVTFYLQDTGRREPPLDNITGVFGRFSSRVSVESGSGPEQFTASVDGRVIAQATSNPGGHDATLDGRIPVGGRFLQLSVSPVGNGTGIASWAQPAVERASEWWAVDALLMVALVALVAPSLAAAGLPLRLPVLLNPGLAVAAIVAAGAVQVAEAMLEVAAPVWSGAIELVIHHL